MALPPDEDDDSEDDTELSSLLELEDEPNPPLELDEVLEVSELPQGRFFTALTSMALDGAVKNLLFDKASFASFTPLVGSSTIDSRSSKTETPKESDGKESTVCNGRSSGDLL